MSKNTSITLGEHFDSFVTEQLKSGGYASTSELVRAGLRLLEEEEKKLSNLRNKFGKACEHIRAGYRTFPVESHIIFYKIGEQPSVDIIRVLHKHMDVSSRLFRA